MTGEPEHAYYIKRTMASHLMFSSERVPQLSITEKVKWFIFSYVQLVTQRYKQRTLQEAPLQSIQSLLWKIQEISVTNVGSHYALASTKNQHLVMAARRNGILRRTKVSQ